MESLPRDIAHDILSRLPITSLLHIKCVSRAWCRIAKDPRLASAYDKHRHERNPCLIIHSNTKEDKKLYLVGDDLINNNKATRICGQFKIIENGYIVEGSCNGLLCVCDAKYFDPKLVINPLTGDSVELPIANRYPNQEISFGFGYQATTREYKLVRVAHYQAEAGLRRYVSWSDVQILTLGSDRWTSIGRCPFLLDYGSSEAFVNESFHWSIRRYHDVGHWVWIISFDLATEEFNEIPAPYRETHNSFSMLVIDECLSVAAHFDDGRIEIWVMREYNVKESWFKLMTISLDSLNQTPYVAATFIWACSRAEKGPVQVLCKLKNGLILLKYKNGNFVLYDPERRVFDDIVIERPPQQFITTLVSVRLSPNWVSEIQICENPQAFHALKMAEIVDSKNQVNKWLPEVEEFFIKLIVEEAQKKSVEESYFDEKTWEMFVVELFKRWGRTYFVYELKSKFTTLRQNYRAFAELLKHTNFRWDPMTNKVTANEDFWTNYLKLHPNGEGFKSKGYKHYNLLDSIFENSTPVGVLSQTSRGPVPWSRDGEVDCWCSLQPRTTTYP